MSARRPGRITVTVDYPEEIFDPVILAALEAGRRVTADEERDVRRRHAAELTAGPAVCCRACGFVLTAQHQACPSIVLVDSRSLPIALTVIPLAPRRRCTRCHGQLDVTVTVSGLLCSVCGGQDDLFGGAA
ncbi:hypothetical protein [Candidatus Frankia alpina]|uniref:Uncharacterized protein n=1 Tax=Candidatus Frankia alpina TaxID=2699483 RepID=A0A4S5CSL9_9ACTN|nr:hypothetical protein [Candidatus Frankia alpina]THJ48001.1 hypothetical protein E7Y31_19495 [Candidatus Frankia alpina]